MLFVGLVIVMAGQALAQQAVTGGPIPGRPPQNWLPGTQQ